MLQAVPEETLVCSYDFIGFGPKLEHPWISLMSRILTGYSTDVSETLTESALILARFSPKSIQKALLALEKAKGWP